LILPGIASHFTPKDGIDQLCATSFEVIYKDVLIPTGIIKASFVANKRKLLSFSKFSTATKLLVKLFETKLVFIS